MSYNLDFLLFIFRNPDKVMNEDITKYLLLFIFRNPDKVMNEDITKYLYYMIGRMKTYV
jgi:hypothetical protein